jgi:hypothetical protein
VQACHACVYTYVYMPLSLSHALARTRTHSDMENCGVSRWVNRVSVGREVSGSPLGEVEASIPEGVVHTGMRVCVCV